MTPTSTEAPSIQPNAAFERAIANAVAQGVREAMQERDRQRRAEGQAIAETSTSGEEFGDILETDLACTEPTVDLTTKLTQDELALLSVLANEFNAGVQRLAARMDSLAGTARRLNGELREFCDQWGSLQNRSGTAEEVMISA